MKKSYLTFILAFSFLLNSCGKQDEKNKVTNNFGKTESLGNELCNNMVPKHCALPFPSNYFTKQEKSSKTGIKLNLPDLIMPLNIRGKRVDPYKWNQMDGYSIASPILTYFKNLDVKGLPNEENIETSISKNSPIVILEEKTGERIPYFLELDAREEKREDKTLIIRPVKRLKDGESYIVAARNLKNIFGENIQPDPGFLALRDGLASDIRGIHKQRNLYSRIFSVLEKNGIAQNSLIQAFQFSTSSWDIKTRDMKFIRDYLDKKYKSEEIKFEIKQKGPGKSKSVGLRVEGNIFLPLFVDRDTFRAKREWNEDGTLKVQGEAVVPFLLNIPKSVANGEKKGRFVLYGHGLMGSRFEADTSWLNEFANEHGYIIIAVDWQGMSTPDAVTNLAALDGKLEDFHYMIDRLHQGFANFLALAKFVKGKFRQHEFFQKDAKSILSDLPPVFHGNSQGAILGTVIMALSNDLELGVLGVGGANYSIMLERSKDFIFYETNLLAAYENRFDRLLFFPLVQILWDEGEGSGYLPLFNDPKLIPNTNKNKILLQIGMEDREVSHLSAHFQARSINAKLISPTTRSVFGLKEKKESFNDSHALVEFNFKVEANPKLNLYPTREFGNVHGGVRKLKVSQLQMHHFFQTKGEIKNFCKESCDPE